MPFGRAKKQATPLDENALYDYAVKALGRRMRTVAELKRLMRSRVESGEQGEAKIDRVVARLKAQRYLNDTEYATSYTRLRQENKVSESGGYSRTWSRRACTRRSSRRRSMPLTKT